MKTIPRSTAELQRMTRRELLKAGTHVARIIEAEERRSKADNDMLALILAIIDAAGNEHRIFEYLLDNQFGALKIRQLAEAIGALARYEADGEIDPADLIGQEVRVKIVIERKRGFPDAAKVESYSPAEPGRVVNLRTGG